MTRQAPVEIPPHVASAERAVLGATLDPDAPAGTLAMVLERTTPEHFWLGWTRRIRIVLGALAAKGPVDTVTLLAALQGEDDWDARNNVRLLFEEGAVAAHVPRYIDVLQESHRERLLDQLGKVIVSRNGSGPAKAIGDIRRVLAELEAVDPGARPSATLERKGLDFDLAWSSGARMTLAAVRDGREGVRGELTVTVGTRRVGWGIIALSSTAARETWRKRLEAAAPGLPWSDYLDEAAYQLTRAARDGEPLVTLTGELAAPTRLLLPGFLYAGEPTLLFADGDTGKSLVAAALATAVQSGSKLTGTLVPVRPVPVAYLDWETTRETLDARVGMLAAGLGIDVPPVLYKRMVRPLVDEAGALAAEFARREIGFVIVDSMMYAVAGGEGAAFHEPINAFYGALRLFAPAASLVVSHVTGADARGAGPARPYGGAFAFNGPRLIWEAKRDRTVAGTAITFTCKKANNLTMTPEPLGLRFQPGAGTITVYPFDLREAAPEALVATPLTFRLRLALEAGPLTLAQLVEATGAKPESVRGTLKRMRTKGTVTLVEDTYHLVAVKP